jgi:hypothetical protein
VIVPARASAPAPIVSDLQISETDQGSQDGNETGCTFTLNGTAYAFAWIATGLVRLP